MLAGSVLGYTSGKDFQCNSLYCYGYGASAATVTQSFVNLQKAINRYASYLKFNKVSTDGMIGEQTRAAADTIARFFLLNAAPGTRPDGVFTGGFTSIREVAEWTTELTSELSKTADKLGLPAASTGSGGSSVTAADASPAGMGYDDRKGIAWYWWVLGAATLAGVGTMAYLTLRGPSGLRRLPA